MLKVTDLELSQCSDPSATAPNPSADDVIDVPQTVNWTAPEVITTGKVAYTRAADCYSLAMVLWELLTGQVPFDKPGRNPSDVARLVVEERARPHVPADTPPEYARLLRRAWVSVDTLSMGLFCWL
jgi:serine/threonine-protein kinase